MRPDAYGARRPHLRQPTRLQHIIMNCVIHVIATVRGWLLGCFSGFAVTGFTVAVRPASGGNPVPTARAEESDSSSPVAWCPIHAPRDAPFACCSASPYPRSAAVSLTVGTAPSARQPLLRADHAGRVIRPRVTDRWLATGLGRLSSPERIDSLGRSFPLAPRAVGPSDWSAPLVGRPARPPDGYRGSPREQSREPYRRRVEIAVAQVRRERVRSSAERCVTGTHDR